MKNLKKILAVALAVVMMAALSVAIFAKGDGSDSLGSGNSVTIKDKLIAYNPDETTIYAPAVTFSYAIAAGTGGATVTDEDGIQAIVKAGVGTPTITESNAYTMADSLNAKSDGDDSNEKDIVVTFAENTFSAAGVYRYTITRTITDDNNALVSKADVVRSLDVYVKEENGTFSIYGYILHDITGDIDKDSTTKYDHYESEYKTSNLVVSKTLVNDSSKETNQFPFSVTFANTKGAHIIVDANEGTTGRATAAAMDAGATTSAPTIAHNGAVKYIGIPNGFTASVYETNNVTGTTYKSEGAADTAADAKNITWSSTNDANKSNTASSAAATDENKTIAFTNTLEIISPTGVILRVAPFAIILLAGIALFVIARRRRVED